MFPRRDDISRLTEQGTRRFSLPELTSRLTANHIWHMIVNDYEAVERDPQVQHNRHIINVPSAAGDATLNCFRTPYATTGARPDSPRTTTARRPDARDIGGTWLFAVEIEDCIAGEVAGTPEKKRQRKGYELKRA